MTEQPPQPPQRDHALDDYVNKWNIVLSLADAFHKDPFYASMLLKRLHAIETYSTYADRKFAADPKVFPKSTDTERIAALDALTTAVNLEIDTLRADLASGNSERATAAEDKIIAFAQRFKEILSPPPPLPKQQ